MQSATGMVKKVFSHGSFISIKSFFQVLSWFVFLLCLFVCCTKKFTEPEKVARVTSSMYMGLPKGLISLTYDDGPGPGTLALAKYLYAEHISATFFVVGDSDPGGGYLHYPVLDSLVYYGQRIGNHTFNHRDLRSLTCNEAQEQISRNQQFIDPVIKNNLCYLTPPWFGWSSNVAKCILGEAGLNHLRGPVGVNFDTHDYLNRGSVRPDICARNFINEPGNLVRFNNIEGGLIKMHDFNSYNLPDFALQETKIIVDYLKAKGYSFVGPTMEFSPPREKLGHPGDFSDENRWASHPGYYGTIRLGDVNGDRQADIIGRSSEGIQVALSNGFGFESAQVWSEEFSDSLSWKPIEYSTTLQCADVNGDGKDDLIIRGRKGMRVALSTGSSFKHSTLWSNQFSDALSQSWNSAVGYFGTIRAADVDGDHKADIIGRGANGVYVLRSTGTSFDLPVLWTAQFSDVSEQGWKAARYSTTLQLADVNGDGKADLMGRSAMGIMVALSTGKGFGTASIWTTSFSDKSGWGNDISYYGAIRLGDVNGDARADLIVRGGDGLHVLLSTGNSFEYDKIWCNAEFTDWRGWKNAKYSITLQCGDINGDRRMDIIGRAPWGITGVVAP